jgi:hypothetical protein
MRRLLAVLALGAVLVACSEQATSPNSTPSFSATSVRDVFVDQFDIPGPLYNACLDEEVQLHVVLQGRLQTVTTAKESRLNIHWRFLDGTRLVGSKTNDVWLPVPGDHGGQIGTASGDFVTVHERLAFHNPTTGQVLEWSSNITFVTNARGEVKVDRMNYLDDCTLRH